MTISADQPLVIGVTGLNATDNPGPGIPVIRTLRDGLGGNIKIIGLSYEPLEPGIYMHEMVDKTYQIPYPAAGTEALLERLQYIREKENVSVIIPNFDAELHNFIKLSSRLNEIGIHTFLPSQKQLEVRDKVNLHSFGKQNNLHVPESVIVNNFNKLKEASEKLQYPLVVKGKYYDATVVQTAKQAQEAFYKLNAKWGLPIIIQQFIKGTEINVAV